jgi:hypothetical protein
VSERDQKSPEELNAALNEICIFLQKGWHRAALDRGFYPEALKRRVLASIDLETPSVMGLVGRHDCLQLIGRARRGDKAADEALRLLAGTLDLLGKRPLAALRQYINEEVLFKTKRRWKKPNYANEYRNALIANAVAILVERGFHPYRGDEPKKTAQQCACSIVTDALAKLEVSPTVGYETVAGIYAKSFWPKALRHAPRIPAPAKFEK